MVTAAKTLSASILARLEEADEDLGRFIKISGWLEVGHESFTDWWKKEAVPVLGKLAYLDVNLKPEVRDQVLTQVVTEDKAKPKAQRHTQKELGEIVGVSEKTIQESKISPRQPASPPTDLGAAIQEIDTLLLRILNVHKLSATEKRKLVRVLRNHLNHLEGGK